MNNTLEAKKKLLADYETRMRSLEAAKDEYYIYSNKADKLSSEIKSAESYIKRRTLEEETNYKACDFGNIYEPDEESYYGSAKFKSAKQAMSLCVSLSESYRYAYRVTWEGKGLYRLIPSSRLDHDHVRVYTGTFEKVKA